MVNNTVSGQPLIPPASCPRALEIFLETKTLGEIRRIYALPDVPVRDRGEPEILNEGDIVKEPEEEAGMTGGNRGSPMHSEQAGVALISILLVVAITVVLSSAMMLEENLVIHKVRNNFDHGQVRQYALGGEELARQILREDYESEDKHDHLQEEWAAKGMEFEFADGEVLLQINDLQGRININTLVNPGSEGDQARTRFSGSTG